MTFKKENWLVLLICSLALGAKETESPHEKRKGCADYFKVNYSKHMEGVQMLPKDCEGILMCLLYPVMLEENPLDFLDHAIFDVIDHPNSKFSRTDAIDNIEIALKSNIDLATLLPGKLTNVQYRNFLDALRAKLLTDPRRP